MGYIPMKGETTMNMNEIITNVTLTKVCSIKADKDSDESKSITLKIKFDGATIQSVFDKAVAGAVIQWQNGVGRKNFDTFKPNQTVEIQFTSPARSTVDPETAMIAQLSGLSPEAMEAKVRDMIAKAKSAKA